MIRPKAGSPAGAAGFLRGEFTGLCRGQGTAAGPAVLRTAETGFARLPAAGGRPAAVGRASAGVRKREPVAGSLFAVYISNAHELLFLGGEFRLGDDAGIQKLLVLFDLGNGINGRGGGGGRSRR